jgi:TonB-dependent starch-binding outer membrane protein SusC
LSLSRYVTVLLVFVTTIAWSQSRTVTGKVTSADDGSGLPGVNVIEKGTNNGTGTDADGNYTINVGSNATLVFSFVGYQSQEVVVGNQTTINTNLASDVTSLSEVVVVGYGTQEKKEITSSVSSVKAEDFNRGTVNDPVQLLQGKVAGLNIVRPGGDPNGGFNIRLRGVSTFGANSEPLVVIDGVIGGSLSTVDPNDIASIDVLKDASAAAIYGSRGGSGVILVTTKSGKSGKVTVDYNGSYATESVARTIDVMSADEYRQVPGAIDLGSNTDWLDLVTQRGYAQVHNLSFSGGTASTTYRASINLRDTEGVGIGSGFTQLNARLNLSQKALKDRATFTLVLSTTSKYASYGSNAAFNYAIIANPTMPVYDNTTTSATAGARFGGYAERDIFDFFNPVSIAEQNTNDGTDTRLLMSLRAEYDFQDVISGLRSAVFYSQQREHDWRGGYRPKTSKFGSPGLGNAYQNSTDRENQLFEWTLNYDKQFGDLQLAVLGGYSYQDFFNHGYGASAGGFTSDVTGYWALPYALQFDQGLGGIGSGADGNKLIAFFGRLNFNYKDTYFLSASLRNELGSRFGEGNKSGSFPAVSAGVTLSNLFDLPAINNLKLRVSYGVAGNQPSRSYLSLARYTTSGTFYYNGAYINTYGPASNENPNLAWEKKSEIDIGLDFSLLNNRLSGTFDYFERTTTDLLFEVAVPQPPNLFPTQVLNIGEVKNGGVELALNYIVKDAGDFRWTTGINLATVSTEIVSLSSGDGGVGFGGEGGIRYLAGMGSPGQNETELIRIKEGVELGQIWGPVKEAVNPDGTVKFKDLNGDGTFCDCDDDRTVIGNGMPDFTLGFNNSFSYKNFDFNLFIRGAFGHDLVNSYRGFYENTEGTTVSNYNVVKTKYYDPNITKAVFNSSHVEDADYVKLDNATIGYNFPVGKGLFTKFRLYVSGQNLFTITDYTGIDPEVRYADVEPEPDDALSPGIERRSTYFTTRTFTFGVNLGF